MARDSDTKPRPLRSLMRGNLAVRLGANEHESRSRSSGVAVLEKPARSSGNEDMQHFVASQDSWSTRWSSSEAGASAAPHPGQVVWFRRSRGGSTRSVLHAEMLFSVADQRATPGILSEILELDPPGDGMLTDDLRVEVDHMGVIRTQPLH